MEFIEDKKSVEFINDGSGKPYGESAQKLVENGLRGMRTNATLQHEEWLEFDQAVMDVALERITSIRDLYARKLVKTIDGLSKTVHAYQDMSDISGAELTMDGETTSPRDRVKYTTNYLPLPILMKGFSFSQRELNASRKAGDSLDTTMVEKCTRQVMELADEMLINGTSSYTYGGGTIYGYEDFPDRQTVTLSINWDDSTKTGSDILDDVVNMKQKLINNRHYGPYLLKIPTAYETLLDKNYSSNYQGSIRERLLKISGIEDIIVADTLSANTVVLVQMTSDVVRIIDGLSLRVVEWDLNGGLRKNFKVMAIIVPQLRSDQDGRSGICVLSP